MTVPSMCALSNTISLLLFSRYHGLEFQQPNRLRHGIQHMLRGGPQVSDLKPSSAPSHAAPQGLWAPIILLRNVSVASRLADGTRLVVQRQG